MLNICLVLAIQSQQLFYATQNTFGKKTKEPMSDLTVCSSNAF